MAKEVQTIVIQKRDGTKREVQVEEPGQFVKIDGVNYRRTNSSAGYGKIIYQEF